MKRTNETDAEWADVLENRKIEAERRMLIEDHKKGFITLSEILDAKKAWACSEHTAEMRLLRGELPMLNLPAKEDTKQTE